MNHRKLISKEAWNFSKGKTGSKKLPRNSSEFVITQGFSIPVKIGRCISRYGKQVNVVTLDKFENPIEPPVKCSLRANLDHIVVGDIVRFSDDGESNIVLSVDDRKSIIERINSQGKIKLLAANIDQMIIVTSPKFKQELVMLDRYLITSELIGVKALIIINKHDLLQNNKKLKEFTADFYSRYNKIGYEILQTSTFNEKGFEELQDHLKRQNSIFTGQSGVGKSSIIKTLLPEEAIKIGTQRSHSPLGRHTTSVAKWYFLDNGGAIIDSPGIRSFGLKRLTSDELEKGFVEISKNAKSCQFRNCKHQTEPNCSVKDAVQQGKISSQRLNSFHYILNEVSLRNG